jgi:hypothetical protein
MKRWVRLGVRTGLPALAALAAIVANTRSFQKQCADSTITQCVSETLNWFGNGILTPRGQVARPKDEKKVPAPVPPVPQPSGAPPASKPMTAAALDRTIVIQNDGDEILDRFHATACTVTAWGVDLLGNASIDRGKRKVFDLADGTTNCCFDLRVVYRGGTQRTWTNVNVCSVSSWAVKNR